MPEIKKIYNLETIGTAKVLTDLQRVNEALEKVRKTKLAIGNDLTETKQQASVAKLNAELAKQAILEEKLTKEKIKNEQEVIKLIALETKAEEQRNKARIQAQKEQAKASKDVPFTSNVDSSGRVIEPSIVKDATTAVSQLEQELLDAQLATSQWASSQKTAGQEVKKTTESVTLSKAELKKLALEEQTQKYVTAEQTRLLKARAREEYNLKGSLENRRAALIRLNAVYDKLTPKERDTAWGLRLNKVIGQLTDQVKALEAGTGRAQRNVGNYSSAFNGLAQNATKAYGVLRTVANILPGFGIGGLVGLGVTGLIELANAMNLLSQTTEAEKEQIKAFTEEHKLMVESVAKETSLLKTNYETATNTNVNYRERGKAVDELIKQYPEYFSNIDREKLLNGELTSVYDSLTESILKRAEAQAKQNRLTKLYEEKVDLEIKLGRIQNNNSKDEFYYTQQATSELQGKLDVKNDEIKAVEKSIQLAKQGFGDTVYYIDQETRRKVEAQNKIDEARAKKGDTSKDDKKSERERIAAEKKAAAESKKQDDKNKKDELQSQKILNEAMLSLLDNHTRELLERLQKYEEDKKKIVNGSAKDFQLLEDAYLNDISKINDKYRSEQLKELDKQVEEMNKAADDEFKNTVIEEAKRTQAEKNAQEERRKNAEKNFEEIRKDQKTRQDLLDEERLKQIKKQQELEKLATDGALRLFEDFYASQAQLQYQAVDNKYDELKIFNDTEKEKRLALAQSKAEEQAIENEYALKQKESDRQRNIERQEIARKQLTIEFALASIKAISTSTNIYEGLIKEGIVIGEYLIALNNLNSQKFEQGGQVPTSTGGDITGPSHAHGGVPFGFEAEGGEMAIINKNSTMDSGTYSLTGTPRQIASAINEIGGGVSFARGATGYKFEYGGLLGSNLSAPVFRSSYSSEGDQNVEMMKAITAINYRLNNLQVSVNYHDIRKAKAQTEKQANVGII